MRHSGFLVIIIAVIFISRSHAGDLYFHADGKFKIMQVTDTHIKIESPHSKETIAMLNQVLDAEKPDLVIYTGDINTGKPVKAGFDYVFEPVISRKIPFACVLGNHDDEQGMTRKEIADLIMTYPCQIGRMTKTEGVAGYGNYVLEIKGNNETGTRALLYCMDTRSGSAFKQASKYAWLAFDQVKWYRETSEGHTKRNSGKPLPALAFFHIPLPEYALGYFHSETFRIVGEKLERPGAPRVNSGMFASMLEKKDVMGMFAGHDHINDYIFNYCGIALAYGRFSGSKTTYTKLKNGVRIIELTEGARTFVTWLRLDSETVLNKVTFPDDFPQVKHDQLP